jgi:hypothetical protein
VRDLGAERIAAAVSEIVAMFPPLTDEQIERISALLRPTSEVERR